MIREGSDITLVGWGAQLAVMEQACVDAEKVSECTTITKSILIIAFLTSPLLKYYEIISFLLELVDCWTTSIILE